MTNDEWTWALQLEGLGLLTEGIGPIDEWAPVPPEEYQQRHTTFWRVVTDILVSEPADYDDLPDWMTETGTAQLNHNN